MRIPIICGPTAVGKTELSLEIAEKLDAEIISMDSMQIYKYMDIGTAKPSLVERNIVPHHMIDIVYPDEEYNVYKYVKETLDIIDKILSRGKIPILVGGTGLYAEGLIKGIVEIGPDFELRKKLQKLEKENPGSLRSMLEEFDPVAAQRIHPNDIKRTIRALEVILKMNRKFSELQKSVAPRKKFSLIFLNRERNELYERINKRVENMIKLGLIDEVKKILRMGYSPELNSMKAIGYKETIDFIHGKYSFDEYIHVLKRNSRHYARRQIIWFRRYRENVYNINLTNMSFKKSLKIIFEIIECSLSIENSGREING
ncbi:MAG: tRNA dimethylallyltransferase [Thermotogaceae bacterium]|nr:tRNA dimethylallyltransferase [Thermotogaceae bacterium]MDN5337490.1 tRNA dimethylallyltransferase [Thermotogaceae bacterium]